MTTHSPSPRPSAPAIAPAPFTANEDALLAAHLARVAGEILLHLRASNVFDGADKALGAAGDATANQFLLHALSLHRPDDAVLSEESKDTKERLSSKRVWIIDPVDGTREYGEQRSDWAVHVGLAVEGEARVGAVALPGLDGGLVLHSAQEFGAIDVAGNQPETPRLVVSRSRPAKEALMVADKLGGTRIPMGSAGAKAMAVLRGEADIYLHSGGQFEWDSCAPVAVARAAGLHCSRIDAAPLRYNQADTYLPDLLICRPQWAEKVLKLIAEG